MSLKPVHQYLWSDYSLPARRRLVLTLKDNEAIAFLALVTTIVAYTQSRVWHTLRRMFMRLTAGNIQLPVPDEPALSQSKAILILLQALRPKRRVSTDSMRRVSPWIGALAVANIICFLTLGIILPWTLSGGLETPVVRSRYTDSCHGFQNMFETSANDARLADLLFKQRWHKLSKVNNQTDPSGQTDGIFKDRPPLQISRPHRCPFPEDVCQSGTRPVRLEHRHLTLRQFGANSRSRVLMSHRLTCSPLDIVNFLKVSSNVSALSFCDWNQPDVEEYILEYSTVLSSPNGSNGYSYEYSGRRAASENKPSRLDIFPRKDRDRTTRTNYTDSLRKMHPDLRRSDGNVFIVGYRAGNSFYNYPMDDPFFAAHELDESPGRPVYLPDYEITGLGCVEQWQFCIQEEPMLCTPWGGDKDMLTSLTTLADKLMAMGDIDSAYDLGLLHVYLTSLAKVQEYLPARLGVQALISSQYRAGNQIRYVDAKEQWIMEVEAWFETSFLRARYGLFNLLEHDDRPEGFPDISPQHKEKFRAICSRIVFFDSNYTNIDFIQFLITLSCLLFLCLLSISQEIRTGAVRCGSFCKHKMKQAFWHCQQGMAAVVRRLRVVHLLDIHASWFRRQLPRQSHPQINAANSNPRNDSGLDLQGLRLDDIVPVASQDSGERLSDSVIEVDVMDSLV